MKRGVLWGLFLIMTVASSAQDFASRFLVACKNDTLLHCSTIGPKMMERIIKMADKDETDKDKVVYLMSKIKSARIITVKGHGASYFDKASELVKRNSNRFSALTNGTDENCHRQVYVRRRKDTIVELVLLNLNENGAFAVINFTGMMDDKFIETLSGGAANHN